MSQLLRFQRTFTSTTSSVILSFNMAMFLSQMKINGEGPSPYKPSFFEMIAQENLIVGLKPALHYVLKVGAVVLIGSCGVCS